MTAVAILVAGSNKTQRCNSPVVVPAKTNDASPRHAGPIVGSSKKKLPVAAKLAHGSSKNRDMVIANFEVGPSKNKKQWKQKCKNLGNVSTIETREVAKIEVVPPKRNTIGNKILKIGRLFQQKKKCLIVAKNGPGSRKLERP